jgi:hypothetical protein
MEEVPVGMLVRVRPSNDCSVYRIRFTKLDDDSEVFFHDIDYFQLKEVN